MSAPGLGGVAAAPDQAPARRARSLARRESASGKHAPSWQAGDPPQNRAPQGASQRIVRTFRGKSKMGSGAPRVTVGIPTFNRSAWLQETITCVLAQTYTDFRLVVSDNASTDDTPAV